MKSKRINVPGKRVGGIAFVTASLSLACARRYVEARRARGKNLRRKRRPGCNYGAVIDPNRPCVSSSGPAAKNSVFVGPALAPLPKPMPHSPSISIGRWCRCPS
jgi:hypothetical protein